MTPSGNPVESRCADDTVYFSYFCQALPFEKEREREQSNKIITFAARDYNVESGRAG